MFKLVEKPVDAGRGRASKPEITIRENGLVSLSKAGKDLAKGDFVEVYNDESGKVGLKFIAKETPNALKVGKNGSFSAKMILQKIGFKFDGNYVYAIAKEKDFITFHRDEGTRVTTRTRKKKEVTAQSFPE